MSSNHTSGKNGDKSKIDDKMKNKKEAPQLSDEELKKVAGGNLGAPIYKKKP